MQLLNLCLEQHHHHCVLVRYVEFWIDKVFDLEVLVTSSCYLSAMCLLQMSLLFNSPPNCMTLLVIRRKVMTLALIFF